MSSKNSKAEIIRHSLSHIMAAAVRELYPNVKFGIGPAIENGFYYDFDFREVKVANPKSEILNPKQIQNSKSQNSKHEFKLTPDDLPKIEKRMREIIKQNIAFVKKEISQEEAEKLFLGQPYKLELIKELGEGLPFLKSGKGCPSQISVYESGGFVDLCAGPHIKNSSEIDQKAFKLTKVAGAYWKGDEKNPMLTRIYGLAFSGEKELADYLKQQEEAEKRDHRKLGAKLDLFSFHDEAPGMAFWHDKGLIMRHLLIDFWRREHRAAGYEEVSTPILLKEGLWHTSKHMQTYRENMYFSKIDKGLQIIKPMNCPGGLLLYKERPRSYKELPMKVGELGLVHRHELAGTLHGLFRVRAFTQDDAHIYCSADQVEQELKKVLKLTLKFYRTFGFKDFHMELSTRPEKYTGDLKLWTLAEKTLEKVLKEMKLPYKINPGDGAFYGPKIDSHLRDSIGRTWQCGTLQLDFAQPENFCLEYIDEKGEKKRPVMLHRTIYGSLERFIGILIEHYGGALPLWLSPVQCWVIPVSVKHKNYSREVAALLGEQGMRVEAKINDETVGKKIREGEMQKIPYLLIVGDKEMKAKNVSVRERGQGDIGKMKLNKFLTAVIKN